MWGGGNVWCEEEAVCGVGGAKICNEISRWEWSKGWGVRNWWGGSGGEKWVGWDGRVGVEGRKGWGRRRRGGCEGEEDGGVRVEGLGVKGRKGWGRSVGSRRYSQCGNV